METLTLARYILELSLMEYDFLKYRESEMAAASLCLAFRMKKCGEWVRRQVSSFVWWSSEHQLYYHCDIEKKIHSLVTIIFSRQTTGIILV